MRRVALAVALVVPVLTAAQNEATKAELKALLGTWVVVGGEAEGKEIPKEGLASVEWTFKAEGKAVFAHRDMKAEVLYTYTIDPSKKPKTIDIVHQGPAAELKGKKQLGIYKIEKGELTLLVTDPDVAEKDRPKEFSTKGKGRWLLLRLARPKDK